MTGARAPATILVADDEPEVRQLVRVMLDGGRYQVVEAADGAEAIQVIESDHVDLVLLDLRMPTLDGWGVIEHLRSTGQLARLPVLTLSAHADPVLIKRAVDQGCRGAVRKPFTPRELRDAISRALDG